MQRSRTFLKLIFAPSSLQNNCSKNYVIVQDQENSLLSVTKNPVIFGAVKIPLENCRSVGHSARLLHSCCHSDPISLSSWRLLITEKSE